MLVDEGGHDVINFRDGLVERFSQRTPLWQMGRQTARQQSDAGIDLDAQLFDRDRVGALQGGRQFRSLFHHYGQSVLQPARDPLLQYAMVRQFQACLLERNQMTREIAAVYGRNIMRPQRLQRARVMPIEKMTTELLQLL